MRRGGLPQVQAGQGAAVGALEPGAASPGLLQAGQNLLGEPQLACALGQHACRQGYRTIYRRLPRFFQELALARADGTYATLLARLARVDCLIIDDWGLGTLTETQRQDLLEVMEDRDGLRSTVITSQLDPGRWHAVIADETLADGICDRVVHNAHRIKLQGESLRKTKEKGQGLTKATKSEK